MKKLLLLGLFFAGIALSEVKQVTLIPSLSGENRFEEGVLSLVASAKGFSDAITNSNDTELMLNHVQALNGLLGDSNIIVWTKKDIIKGWFRNQINQTDYVIQKGLGLNVTNIETALLNLGLAKYEDLLNITLAKKAAYLSKYLESMTRSLSREDGIDLSYIKAFHANCVKSFSQLKSVECDFLITKAVADSVNTEVADSDEEEIKQKSWLGKALIVAAIPVIAYVAYKGLARFRS